MLVWLVGGAGVWCGVLFFVFPPPPARVLLLNYLKSFDTGSELCLISLMALAAQFIPCIDRKHLGDEMMSSGAHQFHCIHTLNLCGSAH